MSLKSNFGLKFFVQLEKCFEAKHSNHKEYLTIVTFRCPTLLNNQNDDGKSTISKT